MKAGLSRCLFNPQQRREVELVRERLAHGLAVLVGVEDVGLAVSLQIEMRCASTCRLALSTTVAR